MLFQVDNFGTENLVEACRKLGVNRFILISSILVNGAAMGQILNPAYIFLNVFGLTLVAKLQAEQYVRKSGINYTIVRPGGARGNGILLNLSIRFILHVLTTLCLSVSLFRTPFMKVAFPEIRLRKLLSRH